MYNQDFKMKYLIFTWEGNKKLQFREQIKIGTISEIFQFINNISIYILQFAKGTSTESHTKVGMIFVCEIKFPSS